MRPTFRRRQTRGDTNPEPDIDQRLHHCDLHNIGQIERSGMTLAEVFEVFALDVVVPYPVVELPVGDAGEFGDFLSGEP